ncbi:MAG: ADP-ribosylglycohydrolase family protein [Megasphaera sp.]|nr:ADP-ribosylglycohydrolase family protein [Megasphaera sp.]
MALWGAIIGDIVGSMYEHQVYPVIPDNFPLFGDQDHITDDTVTTVAIAAAIRKSKGNWHTLSNVASKELRYWCRKYPDLGYGLSFMNWFMVDEAPAYGSWANGSAMRVSAAGWVGNSEKETEEIAALTSRVTHDHPEGIAGAKATAVAIYLARTGSSKEDIKAYIQEKYYPLQATLREIKQTCIPTTRASLSVPEAIQCFLESTSYEDALRNAVTLNCDTDTQSAIAGSIAEAFYGIPEQIIMASRPYIPAPLHTEIEKFHNTFQIQ